MSTTELSKGVETLNMENKENVVSTYLCNLPRQFMNVRLPI